MRVESAHPGGREKAFENEDSKRDHGLPYQEWIYDEPPIEWWDAVYLEGYWEIRRSADSSMDGIGAILLQEILAYFELHEIPREEWPTWTEILQGLHQEARTIAAEKQNGN